MDISSLRERGNITVLTVSELNNYIKSLFDSSRFLSSVTVKGEISNFTNHRSGHLYFSLKDAGGQIKAVMFSSAASTLKFLPESGMKVIVSGSVSVYAQGGAYQIYVKDIQPDGIGALHLAYEQLKERLFLEGLFDDVHKRPIPEYPCKIGVITSPTGAAVRDIITVVRRRYPLATIYLYPSLVQGDGAEASLIKAVDYFDKSGLCDVVIIGRGGGSIEDLWAFNSEALARRIFSARVPIISAVGHETDFTICDFVSDLRAPTPSAAAELAVADVRELAMRIDALEDRCSGALVRCSERARGALTRLSDALHRMGPEKIVGSRREDTSELNKRAADALKMLLLKSRNTLSVSSEKLSVLNPLSVLARGYSVLEGGRGVVKSVKDVSIGDRISVILSDGKLSAEVKEKTI